MDIDVFGIISKVVDQKIYLDRLLESQIDAGSLEPNQHFYLVIAGTPVLSTLYETVTVGDVQLPNGQVRVVFGEKMMGRKALPNEVILRGDTKVVVFPETQ